MKSIIALIFCLTVILQFQSGGERLICPPFEPVTEVKLNAKGVWYRHTRYTGFFERHPGCTSPVTYWREEWTDYPNRGGKFIREIEK